MHPRFPGSIVLGLTVLLALTVGLVRAAPTVTFDTTIGPPPASASFDISFVKNDIAKYILADRTNNQVDLFDAKALTFTGGIGTGGFVGNHPACAVFRACSGPNGVVIDNNNNVWAGDGPASDCSTPACRCSTGETTSMVKEYTLAVSSGATGRLACLDTGGNFRADEMAFDPRDNLLLVANDADGFLSLINTAGTAAIVDQFFYADNDVGKPASARGLSTAGGGIEQPVWNPQQGFFYQALPGSPAGRIDIFNPKPGKLVFLRSITVTGCVNGPTGLALNTGPRRETEDAAGAASAHPAAHNADRQFLGACDNGAALIDANSGSVTILGSAATIGGADEIWFDPGTNAWYLAISGPPAKLGVVSAGPDHAVQVVTHSPPACCGHSVAVYTATRTEDAAGAASAHPAAHDADRQSFIFDPNADGSGISVFKADPPSASTTNGPGDFNGDGFVDIRDYGMWRQSFGTSNCAIAVDATNNCTVDIRAYGVWRQNFGQGAASTAAGH